MENNNCIFCKIVKGEIPSHKVWEDKEHLAILDINSINPGHTLLIPKKHEDYLFDLNDNEYSSLMLKCKAVAKILKGKLNPKRVGMAVEGFGVPHVHIHLVPINNPNELNPERAKQANNQELIKMKDILTN